MRASDLDRAEQVPGRERRLCSPCQLHGAAPWDRAKVCPAARAFPARYSPHRWQPVSTCRLRCRSDCMAAHSQHSTHGSADWSGGGGGRDAATAAAAPPPPLARSNLSSIGPRRLRTSRPLPNHRSATWPPLTRPLHRRNGGYPSARPVWRSRRPESARSPQWNMTPETGPRASHPISATARPCYIHTALRTERGKSSRAPDEENPSVDAD